MSTPANSTAFAVRGRPFNLSVPIRSSQTQNPLPNLTGLAAMVRIDDGGWNVSATTPVEDGVSGWASVDLSAAEMTGAKIDVMVIATNQYAVYGCVSIAPLWMDEFAGRYDAQSVIRLEQLLHDVQTFLYNQQDDTGAQQVIRNSDGTQKVSGVVTEGDLTGTRGRLS